MARTNWLGAAIAMGLIIGGCKNDKKDAASTPSAKPAAADSGATVAAAAPTSSATSEKKQKKKASKKPDDAKKEAEKHPESDKDKAIDDKAGRVDKNMLGARQRKKREGGPDSQCKGAPDGAGICAGDLMAFCVGEDAYLLDCNQYEIDSGFAGGTCVQVGMNPDCYGITPSDDTDAAAEYHVYCDPDEDSCCDSNGYCWHDSAAGDDN